MRNRLYFLIGLVILGVVFVGVGIWFLANPLTKTETIAVTSTVTPEPTQTGQVEISVVPAPGSILVDSNGTLSEIMLNSVQIEQVASDKQYTPSGYPEINTGDYILKVSGTIQNKHETYEYLTMYAEGYDNTGNPVAITLDSGPIQGLIGLHLETDETGEFTLHLNFTENLKLIRIYASTYEIMPP